LSGITRAQSGPPHHDSREFLACRHSRERRRAIGFRGYRWHRPSLVNWFNPAAFANAFPDQSRHERRGHLHRPYVFVTDLSLRKYFKLPRENMGLMFESDFFNIFNRANYSLGSLGKRDLDGLPLATSEALEARATRATCSLD